VQDHENAGIHCGYIEALADGLELAAERIGAWVNAPEEVDVLERHAALTRKVRPIR
jgi:hypothetical protein